jgi:hypothetical protein
VSQYIIFSINTFVENLMRGRAYDYLLIIFYCNLFLNFLKRIIMKKLILSLLVSVAFATLIAQNTKYDTNTGGAGSGNASFGVGTLPITSASGNTALGINAMNANSTGASNSAVGNGAMKMNSSGYGNSAVGQNAL